MGYLVAQLGARMHYAVPRMLHEADMLSHFYTDICAVKGWPRALGLLPGGLRPQGLKRLLGRVPVGVPPEKITAFTSFGWEYHSRRAASRTPTDITRTHLWAGKRFCELVLAAGLNGVEGVYTFNSAGLELLAEAKRRGLITVMEQTIAPREIEMRLLREERDRFPEWESPIPEDGGLDEFVARERAEWEQADVILCGSEFVREGVESCGGRIDRCIVVPYGVDNSFLLPDRLRHEGPLRILTVGAVGLRKGSQHILEAAKQLQGKAVFRLVGPVAVLPQAEAELRKHVELTGPVPRTEILKHYAWADVYLLPSICEGSATSIYEAMTAGLPVICTPNAGSVVRDSVDGYVIPAWDSNAIVSAIEKLTTTDLRHVCALNARTRAQEFSMAAYRQNLLSAIYSLAK